MQKQNGFSIFALLSLLTIIGLIAGQGWLLYTKHSRTGSTRKTPAYSYHYTPVPIDTSQWYPVELFQGFTIKAPIDWRLHRGGEFGPQIVNGKIEDLQHPQYILHQVSTLSTDNLKISNSSGNIEQGARIELNVTLRDNTYKSLGNNENEDPADPCKTLRSYWGNNREIQELVTPSFKACQIQLAGNQYDFTIITNKFYYTTELVFGKNTNDYKKNYYISLTQELVKHYAPV